MSEYNNYTDSSFSLYQAYSYTLLLQLELTTFSFAVVQNNRLLVSAQQAELSELLNPTQLTDLLSATYKKVIIGLPATGLTLLPKSLVNEDHVSQFARFLDVKVSEKVFAQTLDDKNTIIYKTNEALVASIEKFGLQSTAYTAEGWITAIAKNGLTGNKLYIEIGKEAVQFLYFASGSLRFYNTFEFKNEDELVYFTSFVAEELNLKSHSVTLVLSGDVANDDKNVKRLGEFYSKIEMNDIKVIDLPADIAPHKILSLAALTLCGSSEAH